MFLMEKFIDLLLSGAARSGNGNSNDAFANQGDWSVDLVISERTPENAAQNFGGFTESGHPLYTGGDGNWSTISEGMGAAGWGSFAANAYNRAAGLGGVALGFNTLSGPQVGAAGESFIKYIDPACTFSLPIGNISFALLGKHPRSSFFIKFMETTIMLLEMLLSHLEKKIGQKVQVRLQ